MARHGRTAEKSRRATKRWLAASAAVVGTVTAAALTVLLLLTKSQLSQLGFAISALERELQALEMQHEKLIIAYAEAYSLERIEAYARDMLGMTRPEPSQYRYIMAVDSQQRTEDSD